MSTPQPPYPQPPYGQQPYGQPPYGQQPYGYAPPPPKRSAIPKVIGILMIIFASLGLLGGLIGLAGSGMNDAMFRDVPELKTWHTVEMVLNLTGLAISILQLYAGIRCVGYKSNGPQLAVLYAVTAMVIRIVNAILVYAWVKPMMNKAFEGLHGQGAALAGDMFGMIMVVGTLFGLAWPIIVLILMTRPAAKSACANTL